MINKLPKATQNKLDLIEKNVLKVMDDVNQNHITVECLKTFLKSGKGFQNFVKTFWVGLYVFPIIFFFKLHFYLD